MAEPEAKIIVAVDDMFFAAKIIGAARHAGKPIALLKSAEAFRQAVEEQIPPLVIIDLNATTFDPLATIQWLKAQNPLASIPIVGFLSHVQVELKRRAEAAGCDLILPRSAFSQRLTEIISGDFRSA